MNSTAPVPRSLQSLTTHQALVLSLVLGVTAFMAIRMAISFTFVGDDYVFLDKTRGVSFWKALATARDLDFGWFRPLSREVHFWSLQQLFGADPKAFRIANVALWVFGLLLYGAVCARVASVATAVIAVVGASAASLWGTPLLWASGSQEVWMIAGAMGALYVYQRRGQWFASAPLALALLGKETAAVVPPIVLAHALLIERKTVRQAFKSTAALWATTVGWALLHPTLLRRSFGVWPVTPELEHRVPWHMALLKGVAASVNVDKWPRPQELDGWAIAGAVIAGALASVLLHHFARQRLTHEGPEERRGRVWWAFTWAAIGFMPLVMPSIGWHAYYGSLGVLGVWLGLAIGLRPHPGAAIGVVLLVTALRVAQAHTVTSDWGDSSYFVRASSMLTAIKDDLQRQHPRVPPHSRMYFVAIPYHIGLIAGRSPAIRVWYDDPTLTAGYYSYYRRRRPGEAPGNDYFFRFDSTRGMVEVKAGEEVLQSAIQSNPRWEQDHDDLAYTFASRGDAARAAIELEKLMRIEGREDAAVLAAVCWQIAGDSVRADRLLGNAGRRMGRTREEMGPAIAQAHAAIQEWKTRAAETK